MTKTLPRQASGYISWKKWGFVCSLFLLFAISVPAQVNFKPIIDQMSNGFPTIENNTVYEEHSNAVLYMTPFGIAGVDFLYSKYKDGGIRTLLLAAAVEDFSTTQLLGDIERSGGVQLVQLEEDAGEPDLYMIKKNGMPIGNLETNTYDDAIIIEFFPFPGAEVNEGINKVINILKEGKLGDYVGAPKGKSGISFESTYQFPGSKECFLTKQKSGNSFFAHYSGVSRDFWIKTFTHNNLEFLTTQGYKLVEAAPQKTRAADDVITQTFHVEKDGKTFALDFWDDLSVLIVKRNETAPSNPKNASGEEMIRHEALFQYIIDSKKLWTNSLYLVQDISDILQESIDMSDGTQQGMEDAQFKMKNAKWKMSNFKANGWYEVSELFDDAIEESEAMGCDETKAYLEELYKPLNAVSRQLAKFAVAADDFIHSDIVSSVDKGNSMTDRYNDFVGAINTFELALNEALSNTPLCRIPASAVKTSATGSTYYELEETYDAPATFMPHSGKYEGLGLVDLLGRHMDDPAVQGFLNKTNSKETFKTSNGYYTYESEGLEITFFEKRVVKIDMTTTTMAWPYNIPKTNINSISQSTLDFGYTGSPYMLASKNNIDFMVYYDENSKQIESLLMSTQAKNARENWPDNALAISEAKEEERGGVIRMKEEEIELRKKQIWSQYGLEAECYYDFSVFDIIPIAASTKLELNRHYTLVTLNGQAMKGSYPGDVKRMLDNGSYPMKAGLIKFGDEVIPHLIHKNNDGSLRFVKDYSVEDSKPVGIGASLGKGTAAGTCKISFLSTSSAAYLAGLRKGDVFLSVDGQSVHGKTPAEVKQLLNGPRGSSVSVEVDRAGQELTFTITRK